MAFLLFVCTNMIRKNPWSVAYFWLRPQAAPCLSGEFFTASLTRRTATPERGAEGREGSFWGALKARSHISPGLRPGFACSNIDEGLKARSIDLSDGLDRPDLRSPAE